MSYSISHSSFHLKIVTSVEREPPIKWFNNTFRELRNSLSIIKIICDVKKVRYGVEITKFHINSVEIILSITKNWHIPTIFVTLIIYQKLRGDLVILRSIEKLQTETLIYLKRMFPIILVA